MIYLQLFWSFFQIGLFSIGGGYAACKLSKAASDGGLELKTSKDGKGNLSLSLKGHYDIADTSKVPMEFYVKTTGGDV